MDSELNVKALISIYIAYAIIIRHYFSFHFSIGRCSQERKLYEFAKLIHSYQEKIDDAILACDIFSEFGKDVSAIGTLILRS